MIKDLVCAIDYSLCAEIALALFLAVFAAVVYGALQLSRGATERFASIPLTDDVEDPRHE